MLAPRYTGRSHRRSGRLDIAVQELLDFRSNEGKKLWLLHHATTDNDTLGRERANKIDQRERKVVRLQIPSGVIGSERLRRVAPTLSERRSRDANPSRQSPW